MKDKNLKNLLKKYEIVFLFLFGSKAKGEKYTHKYSDIDLAYLSKRDLSLKEESQMLLELSKFFRSSNLDLVDVKKAPPLLLKNIFENHKVIYCKDKKLYRLYQIYAIRKYLEAKPIFEIRNYQFKKFMETYGR